MSERKFIIVAPHADDEVIGCFTLLRANAVDTIVFGTEGVMKEFNIAILKADIRFDVKCNYLDNYPFVASINKVFLFPDPTYETHPEHRRIGMLGEEILRAGGNVVFYTVNMSAPYIFEVVEPLIKRKCLDSLYPNKKSLWEYDHRYFLFEGYTKWLIGGKICLV